MLNRIGYQASAACSRVMGGGIPALGSALVGGALWILLAGAAAAQVPAAPGGDGESNAPSAQTAPPNGAAPAPGAPSTATTEAAAPSSAAPAPGAPSTATTEAAAPSSATTAAGVAPTNASSVQATSSQSWRRTDPRYQSLSERLRQGEERNFRPGFLQRITLGLGWSQLWFQDPAWHVLSKSTVARRVTFWAGLDLVDSSALRLSLELGFGRLDLEPPSWDYSSVVDEFRQEVVYAGAVLALPVHELLAPYVRGTLGAQHSYLRLQGNGAEHDEAVLPQGTLGLGLELHTRTRPLWPGEVTLHGVGVRVEGGLQVGKSVDFEPQPDLDSTAIPITYARLGNVGMLAPYFALSVWLRL